MTTQKGGLQLTIVIRDKEIHIEYSNNLFREIKTTEVKEERKFQSFGDRTYRAVGVPQLTHIDDSTGNNGSIFDVAIPFTVFDTPKPFHIFRKERTRGTRLSFLPTLIIFHR